MFVHTQGLGINSQALVWLGNTGNWSQATRLTPTQPPPHPYSSAAKLWMQPEHFNPVPSQPLSPTLVSLRILQSFYLPELSKAALWDDILKKEEFEKVLKQSLSPLDWRWWLPLDWQHHWEHRTKVKGHVSWFHSKGSIATAQSFRNSRIIFFFKARAFFSSPINTFFKMLFTVLICPAFHYQCEDFRMSVNTG